MGNILETHRTQCKIAEAIHPDLKIKTIILVDVFFCFVFL